MEDHKIEGKDLETYRMLYLQTVTQSYQWLREQSPYLWQAFQNTIYTLIKIEEYKQEIERCEEKITQLDLEIKQATRIVAGEEAILGWAGKNPLLASAIDNLQKIGLSTVPIVTLFTIAGVGSILNPFANGSQNLGVTFLLWSSVAFVFLTSSGIIKLTHRLSRRHWQQTFFRVEIRHWFILGCLLFGLIEGIGGGLLAAKLIDVSRETLNNRGSNLPKLEDWDKNKITAIVSLFAYLNIFFSIAKGREIRILQSNKIRRDRASKVMENASKERDKTIEKIENIKSIGENLEGEIIEKGIIAKLEGDIKFDITTENKEQGTKDLSNANTRGANFIDKHPGTYQENASMPTSNGNVTDKVKIN
jgi:hypothetical protein